ncbi:MAG: LOG family protein [Bdellovibrionota bacterium]
MHERKQKLYELSHAFVALPGGPGTMDEWFEILTWAQLRHHNKPIYILNIEIDGAGYFAPLIAQLNNVVKYGFMRA